MQITIGSMTWETKAPRPAHLARVAVTAGSEHTRLSWFACLVGLSHPSPPWGSLAEAGHDPVEYGDRVIDSLGGTYVVAEIIRAASDVVGAYMASPTEEGVEAQRGFSMPAGEESPPA